MDAPSRPGRDTGAELKWFASRQMVDAEGEDLEVGAKIELLFTVKNHGEYRGKKQTTVTRGNLVTEATKMPRWINLDGQIFGSKKAMLAAG